MGIGWGGAGVEVTRSVATSRGSMPGRETESSWRSRAREPPECSWSKGNTRQAGPGFALTGLDVQTLL